MKNTKHILIILLLFSCFTGFTQKTELLPLKKIFKQTLFAPKNPNDSEEILHSPRAQCSQFLPDTSKTEILNLRVSGFDFRDSIPINFDEYPNLYRLHFNENKFYQLPTSIYNLSNLQVLIIKWNRERHLHQYQPPEELWQLKNLRYLTIMEVKNLFIPEKISQLQNLEFLRIQDAEVLPLSIAQLKKLKVLIVTTPSKFQAEIKFIKTFLPNLIVTWYPTYHPSYCEYKKDVKRLLRKKLKHKQVIINGKYQSFYEKGQLELEGEIINGVPDGKWTFYYENGNVKQERYYKNGIETGTWNFWREQDNKNRIFRQMSYANNAKQVTIRDYYETAFKETQLNNGLKQYEKTYFYIRNKETINKVFHFELIDLIHKDSIPEELIVQVSNGAINDKEFLNQFILCNQYLFEKGKIIEEKQYCNK